jgi:hypothetical protein
VDTNRATPSAIGAAMSNGSPNHFQFQSAASAQGDETSYSKKKANKRHSCERSPRRRVEPIPIENRNNYSDHGGDHFD